MKQIKITYNGREYDLEIDREFTKIDGKELLPPDCFRLDGAARMLTGVLNDISKENK